MDADCPCCSPPWAMVRGTGSEFCYVAGFEGTGTAAYVFKLDEDGIATRFYPPGVGDLSSVTIVAITVDRQKTLYFATRESFPKLHAVDGSGTLLWTTTIGLALGIFPSAICVGLDGYVYVTNSGAANIQKFDKTTGTEVTSGVWPLSPSGAATGAMCIDKAGNLYVAGPSTVITAIDPSGTTIWQTTLASGGLNNNGQIAINEANDTLVYFHNSTVSSYQFVEIDAATGGTTLYSAPTYAGDADYSPDGSPVTVVDNRFGIIELYRNYTSFYSTDDPFSVACGVDDSVYACRKLVAGYGTEVIKLDTTGSLIWTYLVPATLAAQLIAIGTGKIGAFGFR